MQRFEPSNGNGHAGHAELIAKLTPAEAIELLVGEGYAAALAEDGDAVQLKFDGTRAMLLFNEAGDAVQFFFGMRGRPLSLDGVNAWNRDFKFSRAYLDRDGDPCLELDLDLAGGVSRARVLDFFLTCRVAHARWMTVLSGKAEGEDDA